MLKVYFAHPFSTKGSKEEKRISEILKSRRLVVINPFDGENEHMKKRFKIDGYFPITPLNAGVWIWDKCIRQIEESDLFIFYVPEQVEIYSPKSQFKTTARGCYAELQYVVGMQTKRRKRGIPYLIQMITIDRHPIVAWALNHGNQLYDSIDNFKRLREINWR